MASWFLVGCGEVSVIGQTRTHPQHWRTPTCRVVPTRHFRVPMFPWERSRTEDSVAWLQGKHKRPSGPRRSKRGVAAISGKEKEREERCRKPEPKQSN
ncbi:hypothetical protein NDU88_009588 [Pleurodeles waltl]|uniref:Uncharacterized protein n=1 Tax=Pleurodeles waltl TaxID=8319 RepID=A0AAV7RWI9_PLEWA|nr:hypothetical protein NDU88_009588 [Pleurodeles waltl]